MMDNLKFTDIKIRTVNVPLKKPIIAHIGTFEYWPYICLDLSTNSNIVGKSYIGPYLVNQLPAIVNCINALAKIYLGRNIRPFNFYEEGFQKLSLLGYQGIGLYSLAALDIAFWDAYSKAANLPLACLLGSELKPIQSYNSRGLWLIPLEKIEDEVNELLLEGTFSSIKVRLGRKDVIDDITVIEKIKKVAGPKINIMSDFNQCYSYENALKRMSELDDQGLYWFEEPINYRDYDGCSKLSSKIKTPITIGENFHGSYDLITSIRKKSSAFIMPDLMRIGGVSGWIKAANIAESFNVPVSTHLFPEVSAHLMNITPTAHWLEWVDWANPILLDTGFKVKNGNYIIPNIPGTGIEWNEENIIKYKV